VKVPCQLASRESIRAFYSDGIVVILATGSASAGDRIDIDMVLPSTTPLEFLLLRCPKPGVWPAVMRPYTYSESFVLSKDPDRVRIAGTIRVHHQDGVDDVRLEAFPEEFRLLRKAPAERGGPRTATGTSSNLSFDEAFAEAVKILSAEGPAHPDALLHVRVDEVGGLFGGIAGFHQLYVRLVAPGVSNGGIVEIAPEIPGPIEEIAPERLQGRPGDVIIEVAPDRPYRPDPEIIVEIAPQQERARPPGEVVVEVAPQYGKSRPGGGDVIVEVAPQQDERARPPGGGEVIVEVAPQYQYGQGRPGGGGVIVEVAPQLDERARRVEGGEVIVEVAPDQEPFRPIGEVIVEVAPDQQLSRPIGEVIVEVAPDQQLSRPIGEILIEVAPDRPEGELGAEVIADRPGPIVEVGPDRPGKGGGNGPIVEVGPDRPEKDGGKGPIVEVGPDRPEKGGGKGPIVEVGPDRPEEGRGKGPIVEVAPQRPESS